MEKKQPKQAPLHEGVIVDSEDVSRAARVAAARGKAIVETVTADGDVEEKEILRKK